MALGYRAVGEHAIDSAFVDPRQRAAGWTTTGSLGAGQEYIRDGGTTRQSAYLAELRVEAPVPAGAVHPVAGLFQHTGLLIWSSLHATPIVPF